ncbi:MAG: zinc-dependent metalloprotease [Proteobacteria bacterium]|nr:zinc-dependent metalloprotease [Pseudomonadota bacterium]
MLKNIIVTVLLMCVGRGLANDLLTDIKILESSKMSGIVKAGIEAEVNVHLLTSRASQVNIELPDGQRITAVLNDVRRNQLSGNSWQGHVSGDESQIITLSIFEDAIARSIHTDRAVYEIQPLGHHRIKLVELNVHVFPECDGGVPAPQVLQENQLQSGTNPSGGVTNTVDVIVVYTPEARSGAGGHNGIKAIAQAAVDAMNSSLSNSLVDTEIVLLYAGEVDYNDSNNSSTDLDWVQASTEVERLKNLYGADMTGLLVDNMSGACGRGYVMRNPGSGFRDYAVQVTRVSCAVGNLSFAHEFGHNMGLEHDPTNGASPGSASYPWSFGHYHSGQYRTVMSYSSECSGGCTRRQYFSNPDVTYLGLPSGIDNERDNARTLELTSPISAAFRDRVADLIYMNGFE